MLAFASLAATVALAALFCVVSVGAQHRDIGRSLVVRIVNEAGIQNRTLGEAIAETNRIYGRAGTELVWSHIDDDLRAPVLIVSLRKVPAGGRLVTSRTLGMTPASANGRPRHAWVFHERIADRAAMLRMNGAVLLGAVIAHEIGHLLLPRGYHSNVGLMREAWDRKQIQAAMWGQLSFSRREAASIQSSAVDLAATLALAPAR